jgi:hypothetical protein
MIDRALIQLRSIGRIYWIILALLTVSVFTVTYYRTASAACYGGTVLGRACYRGYFSNTEDKGGTNVLPAISNGQAVPSTTVNDADALYNLLRNAYGSGSAQRRSGAAFIYNTMMGNNAPGVGRNVSDAQWNDLHDRLKTLDNAGKIDWRSNVRATTNSYWQGTNEGFRPDGTTDDDAFYAESKNEPGITIRDYDNNIVYEILRRCANPVGSLKGLPEARNYELTPFINTISPTDIEAGSKVSVAGSVDNTGQTQSQPTQWEITQITVQPGKKAPYEDSAATISGTAPCQSNGGAASGNYFDSSDADCKNVAKGSGRFNMGTPAQNLKPTASGIDVGDLAVGTRVCFALSVQPRAGTDSRWAHSKPVCTVVGKKPKVQIWGGDIAVRGNIEASTSVKDVSGTTKTFGSWVEYGAFSVGTNSRFASGSGTNNQTSNDQNDWSKLTFANVNSSGAVAFGRYTTAADFRSAPNIASFFGSIQNKSAIGSGSVDLGSLTFKNSDPTLVRTAGNLNVTGGAIPSGRSVVIIATGTVTISGNITYTDGSLGSVQDIPQVVIIANNIDIQDNVSRIDAWLVAGGTINTCNNFSGNLTSKKCGTLLEVNGPVVTNKLILNRTAGSGTGASSGDPAERFNLRPDAYLWAQLQASGSNKAQTVYTVELPPRF